MKRVRTCGVEDGRENMLTDGRDDVQTVEARMSRYMVRLGTPVAIAVVIFSTIVGSKVGFISSTIAVSIVLVNLGTVGLVIGKATNSSPAVGMAAAMGSFFVILIALTVFVVLAHNASWLNLRIFGISMISLHLIVTGLAARKVSAKLAFSGLFPSKKETK